MIHRVRGDLERQLPNFIAFWRHLSADTALMDTINPSVGSDMENFAYAMSHGPFQTIRSWWMMIDLEVALSPTEREAVNAYATDFRVGTIFS